MGYFNKSKTLHGQNSEIFREHLFNIRADEIKTPCLLGTCVFSEWFGRSTPVVYEFLSLVYHL